jgi:hypothetical protein
MHHDPSTWLRLTPERIAQLPEAAAVFEVASLVRTVHYIGCAEGNLRARISALWSDLRQLPQCAGGYYLRYERTEAEAEALERRLASYRQRHRGNIPAGNRDAATGPRDFATPPLRVAMRRRAA